MQFIPDFNEEQSFLAVKFFCISICIEMSEFLVIVKGFLSSSFFDVQFHITYLQGRIGQSISFLLLRAKVLSSQDSWVYYVLNTQCFFWDFEKSEIDQLYRIAFFWWDSYISCQSFAEISYQRITSFSSKNVQGSSIVRSIISEIETQMRMTKAVCKNREDFFYREL